MLVNKINFIWDKYSDQPAILSKEDKRSLRDGYLIDFVKLILTNIVYLPLLFLKFLITKDMPLVNKPKSKFSYGLCVNLDKGDIQYSLVEELGVKSLQIRVFLNDIKNIDSYVEFAKGFGSDKHILITIIQNREHIVNKALLIKDIKIIFQKFGHITQEFQIGNAINRIKWSFISIEEYLEFFATIQDIRNKHFPHIKLIGSSVIDFEYHFTVRTLFNTSNVIFDKISSLLYVDRRGNPNNTQYGIFNLKEKINFLYAIVSSSKRCSNEIYITETNYPLKNTAPYSPTSEKECVSEDDYAKFMKEYFRISKQSGKISKVFWHQLIATGYGLIDNRYDTIRKTKAYYEFKKMIENEK